MKKSVKEEYNIKLRIVAIKPPVGFWYWLEDDQGNNISAMESKGEDIALDFDVIVKKNKNTDAPNFAGSFAKGTPSKRFFYINNGRQPGQVERRAKVWISGKDDQSPVTWETIKELASDSKNVLVAKYAGKGEDGGPNAATVDLIDGGWIIIKQ